MEVKSHMDFFGNSKKEDTKKRIEITKNAQHVVEEKNDSNIYIIAEIQKQEIAILKSNNHELRMRLYFSVGIIVMLSLTVFKILH